MKKKNVVIIMLTILIVVMAIAIICLIGKNKSSSYKESGSDKNYSVDGSKMSDTELLQMLKKEGYNIEITGSSASAITTYIILSNDTEGITIQRIYNQYIGTLMTFRDESINSDYADLLDTSENNTKDKEIQYKAYQSWLERYNITKTQLSDMLDNYYDENSTDTNTTTPETNTSTTTNVKPTENNTNTSATTLEQKNALAQAKSYLQVMSFSKTSLKEQLLFEGYAETEATYGVENCGADWNEQAYKKANSYINIMSFSKTGLMEQLEYEGFTSSEIEYAINKIGY